jgi:hypothetical protein
VAWNGVVLSSGPSHWSPPLYLGFGKGNETFIPAATSAASFARLAMYKP